MNGTKWAPTVENPRADMSAGTDTCTTSGVDDEAFAALQSWDLEWMLVARCRDAALPVFFPSDGVGVEKAKRICQQCPVRTDCLEYALNERIEHGVWGGCSERERRRIARGRRMVINLAS